MIFKLLTEHHMQFLSLKKAAEARPSLHLSKCQIVGNPMRRLNYHFYIYIFYTELIKGHIPICFRMFNDLTVGGQKLSSSVV